MSLTFTYDPSTLIGKVRGLLGDTNVPSDPPTDWTYSNRLEWTVSFADQEIQAWLDMSDSVYCAAYYLLLNTLNNRNLTDHFAKVTVQGDSWDSSSVLNSLNNTLGRFERICLSGGIGPDDEDELFIGITGKIENHPFVAYE